jgi:hypothetical protein
MSIAIVAATLLGYLAPGRPWRYGLAIMLAQAVTMVTASSSFVPSASSAPSVHKRRIILTSP